MHIPNMKAIKATTLLTLLSTASAATIRIEVGKNGLSYSPDSVTAKTGDVLEYHFHGPLPHSVAMGDFSSPCNPAKTGGFYSGMINTDGDGENSNVFRVTVNSTTTPIFFYCTVPGHCSGGMAGVVNPPSSGSETLAAYKNGAQSANVVAPPSVFGGQLGPASSGGGSTTTGSSSSSTAAPTSGGNSGGGNGYGGSGGGNGNGGAAVGVSVAGVLGGLVGVAALMI